MSLLIIFSSLKSFKGKADVCMGLLGLDVQLL